MSLQQPREGPAGVAFPFGQQEAGAEEPAPESANSGILDLKECHLVILSILPSN